MKNNHIVKGIQKSYLVTKICNIHDIDSIVHTWQNKLLSPLE